MYPYRHQARETCEVYWWPLMVVACTQLTVADVVTMLVVVKALPRTVDTGDQVSPMKVAAYV